MGIFLLLFSFLVALVAAMLVGAVFGGAAHLLTRRAGPRHRLAVTVASLFPVGCVVLLGAGTVCYVAANTFLFHRESGMLTSPHAMLPHGYVMDLDDTRMTAEVSLASAAGPAGSQPTLTLVRQMQVTPTHVFAAIDTHAESEHAPAPTALHYVSLDLATHAQTDYASLDQLRASAQRAGVQLHLLPLSDVQHDLTLNWFDKLAATLLVYVPMLSFVGLSVWLLHVRSSAAAQSPAR